MARCSECEHNVQGFCMATDWQITAEEDVSRCPFFIEIECKDDGNPGTLCD